MFDLIIRNGLVADGLGNPFYKADIGIQDGKIAVIDAAISESASRIIDAADRVVSPGFIDIHSHTDELLLINPTAESKTSQGVTTIVGGNCGCSAAPVIDRTLNAEAKEYLEKSGIEYSWKTIGEFLNVLDRAPMAVNFATYIGHGNLRAAVIGYENRTATDSEIHEMQEIAEKAVLDGAVGMSAGLFYPPSGYANTDELIEIMKALAPHGGLYASHLRNEREHLWDAVSEAIEIGRRSGAGIQLSHHKATDKPNWGRVRKSLALMDAAREEGISVTADQYPYQATATGLTMFLPGWINDGDPCATLARLQNDELCQRAKKDMNQKWPLDSWEGVVITALDSERNLWTIGKSITEIAKILSVTPVDAVIRLLLEENLSIGMIRFCLSEDDIRYVMRHPMVMVCSDASAKATKGIMAEGKPHPRGFGSFARVLGHYCRDEKVLTLPQAIRKMTSLSADRLGFTDRGRLIPGAAADITIFDPATIAEKATYQDPIQRAVGIHQVIVNGGVIYEEGEYTGVMSGKVLRHSGRSKWI